MLKQVILMSFVAWTGLTGVAQAQESTQLKQDFIKTYSRLVYLNYADAYNKALDLQDCIEAFLNRPNEGTLAAAQQSWLMSRVPYGQSEVFRFYEGPIDFVDEVRGLEGPEGRLNSWPLDEAYIDYVEGNPKAGLVQNTAMSLTKETLSAKNQENDEADVALGYHSIEFLLWGQDLNDFGPGQRPVKDYLLGDSVCERRRTYLRLVTEILIEDLKFLVNEWDPQGRDNYVERFLLKDVNVVLADVLTSLATMSGFELSAERMAVPLDSGDPEDEHSCFSDNTHNDFLFNALGLANVYYGTYGTFDGTGLDQIIVAYNADLDQMIREKLNQVFNRMGKIGVPIDYRVLGSFEDSRERRVMEQTIQALMSLADLFKQAGPILGVNVEMRSE